MMKRKDRMRVAMYYNNRDVRVEQMPVPRIEAGEILVRVMASGVCGSDVMQWYRLKKAPLVLGHEMTGEIVETKQSFKGYKAGDRVFVSHHVPCNRCRYCLSGNHTVCETLHTTNFFPGGFAEYVRVPAYNVERGVFLLPSEVSFEEGTFIEPLACVIRGQRVAGLKPGNSVLILGSGISGLIHLLMARAGAAGRIIVTDINSYRLNWAKKLGADHVINAREDIRKALLKANDNRPADVVIVCTSALPAFIQALKCVDRAGTILCFAPTEPGIKIPLPVNDFWRNGVTITHSYGNSPYDATVAIELIRAGIIPVTRMITHCLGLNEAQKAFRLVAEGRKCIKVIIKPSFCKKRAVKKNK